MSDKNENTENAETSTEDTTATEAQNTESTESAESTSTEDKAAEDAKDAGKDNESELPEWARKELTKVRSEAANYRTKLREAEAALKDAKTPEEFEAARKEMSEQIAKLERQVLVSDVAQSFNLPKELQEVLKGDTKEELEAHAKTLQKFVPTAAPEDLSGGLNPSDDPDDDDPYKAAMAAIKRRR